MHPDPIIQAQIEAHIAMTRRQASSNSIPEIGISEQRMISPVIIAELVQEVLDIKPVKRRAKATK